MHSTHKNNDVTICIFMKFDENSMGRVDFSVEFDLRNTNKFICLNSIYISFTSIKRNQSNDGHLLILATRGQILH